MFGLNIPLIPAVCFLLIPVISILKIPFPAFFSLEYPRIPSTFYPNIPHPITPYKAFFLKVRHTVTAAVWERGTKSELEWEVEIEYIFRFLRVDSKIQTTKVSFSGLN